MCFSKFLPHKREQRGVKQSPGRRIRRRDEKFQRLARLRVGEAEQAGPEPLRELYVTAYTLPTTSDFIYRSMLGRLCEIFQPYLPQAHENDFFELEIASASVTRGFMARKCDMYFTMERKLRRFLSCCYRLYEVPAAEYAPVIEQIVQTDLRSAAEKIIASTVRQAELGFEGELARNTAREAQ